MGLKKDKLWYKYEKLYVLPKQKLSCVGICLKMNIRGGSGVTKYYIPWEQVKKGKGAHEPKAQTVGAYPSFLSMKHAQKNCLFPREEKLVHRIATPSSMLPAHLCTWVKRDKVD